MNVLNKWTMLSFWASQLVCLDGTENKLHFSIRLRLKTKQSCMSLYLMPNIWGFSANSSEAWLHTSIIWGNVSLNPMPDLWNQSSPMVWCNPSAENWTADQHSGANDLTTKQNISATALIHLCEGFSAKIFFNLKGIREDYVKF